MIAEEDVYAVFPAAIQVPRDMTPPSPVLVLDLSRAAEPVGTRYAKGPLPKLRKKLNLDPRTGQRKAR